jgi:hypothetical protein
VTRAAETFTIPAANLPWPTETYGPELVTNGTFDTDTSGWTAASFSVGQINFTQSSGEALLESLSAGEGVVQALSLTVGKAYTVSGTLRRTSGSGDGFLAILNNAESSTLAISGGVSSSSNTNVNFTFVATETNSKVYLRVSSSGTEVAFDNISVRELTRYPVSIQMNGRMTYADTGENNQITVLDWVKDVNNSITCWFETNGGTGRFQFRQEENGTPDDVFSGGSVLSPGIFVPYNIASRHGMTFINGAVDGVALTANTTPTNLPDLSATDLDLAYDYMGTVERFRVWGVDLGDDGIENATTGEPASYLIWDQANDDYVQRIFQ